MKPAYEVVRTDPGHTYEIKDGPPLVATTKVLKMIPIPLQYWGQGIGIKGTLEVAQEDPSKIHATYEEMLKLIKQKKLSVYHKMKQGGDRGSAVHEAFEEYAKTGNLPYPNQYPEAWQGYVRSLAGYLVAFQPEILAVEERIGSKEHRYGGTFDAIVKTNEGIVERIDLKTSKGIYWSHHVQLAAYDAADLEMNGREVDQTRIVRLSPDAKFSVEKNTQVGRGRFKTFLQCLEMYRDELDFNAGVV